MRPFPKLLGGRGERSGQWSPVGSVGSKSTAQGLGLPEGLGPHRDLDRGLHHDPTWRQAHFWALNPMKQRLRATLSWELSHPGCSVPSRPKTRARVPSWRSARFRRALMRAFIFWAMMANPRTKQAGIIFLGQNLTGSDIGIWRSSRRVWFGIGDLGSPPKALEDQNHFS